MKHFLFLFLFINTSNAQQYIKNLTARDLTVTNAISGSINGNAATVTTNANLTGAVTSTGNATLLGSFSSSNLLTALSDETGTGLAVFSTSPSLTTPSLGVATATSINGTSVPSSKTLVVTTDKLSVHASTTSSELAGVISDETGSGSLVFSVSPSFTTPSLGAASASSLSLSSPLTVANGGTGLTTLTANNVILGNGSSTPNFVAPGTSGNVLTSNGTTWTSAALGTGSSQVLTPGSTNPVLVSALVSASGVVSSEDDDFISGNFSVASTSVYSGTFTTSYWASAPKCWAVPYGTTILAYYSATVETTTAMQYHWQNMAGSEVATAFKYFCKGNKN